MTGSAPTPVRVKPATASQGWGARMKAKGYRVLSRPGPFGRTHWLVKKGNAAISFQQGQGVAVSAQMSDADVERDLREAGALF